MSIKFTITKWSGVKKTRSFTEATLTEAEFVELLGSPRAKLKDDLPMINQAIFGDVKNDRGSLRHADNVRQITGITLDIDNDDPAWRVTYDEVVAKLRQYELYAVATTSPSHRYPVADPEKHRGPDIDKIRVFLPFIEPKPPGEAERYFSAANTAIGGHAKRESWAKSQGFFYGVADDNPDNYRCDVVAGLPLDHPDAGVVLDATMPPSRPREPAPPIVPKLGADDRSIEDFPTSTKRKIKKGDPALFGFGDDRSRLVFDVACDMVKLGCTDERIALLLLDKNFEISAHCREQSNPLTYAMRQAQDARKRVSENEAQKKQGRQPKQAGNTWYDSSPDGIRQVTEREGEEPQRAQLTNFEARIVEEVAYDDGGEDEPRKEFTIHTSLGQVRVNAGEYDAMGWVTKQLGAKAYVFPGRAQKEHAAVAIKALSDIKKVTRYTHTGWRKIDGHWVYLHAAGGIGASGPVDDIATWLPGVFTSCQAAPTT